MKEVKTFILLSAFMFVILTGCQTVESTETDLDETSPEEQPVDSKIVIGDGEITKLSISKVNGTGDSVIEDSSSIETLKSIVSSAVKEDGIVNMASPDYHLIFTYENEKTQRIDLWLGTGEQKSALMLPNETHTIYTISKEMNDTLSDLIK